MRSLVKCAVVGDSEEKSIFIKGCFNETLDVKDKTCLSFLRLDYSTEVELFTVPDISRDLSSVASFILSTVDVVIVLPSSYDDIRRWCYLSRVSSRDTLIFLMITKKYIEIPGRYGFRRIEIELQGPLETLKSVVRKFQCEKHKSKL